MSSLLDELGIDPEDFEWQDLALCQGIEIKTPEDHPLFDAYENDIETAKAQDEMCLVCPVIKQCFMAGAKGEFGVWGGVYWNGAGKPDKNKNAHKSEETWDRIYKRVSE